MATCDKLTLGSLRDRYLETHGNGTLEERTLDGIRLHFKHLVPIAGVLVRRASSSTTNLREMCDALAQEIASPSARQKFLTAVHSHLRISGQH